MQEIIDVMRKLDVINKFCLVYFLHELEKEGINLEKMQPEFDPIKKMREYFFTPSNEYPPQINGNEYPPDVKNISYVKNTYEGKAVIKGKDLGDLDFQISGSLEKYFDNKFKKAIQKCACSFVNEIKKYPESDIIFSRMPVDDILETYLIDPKSRFSSRLICVNVKGDKNFTFIFDFNAVFVYRFRRENHPLLGEMWRCSESVDNS